MSETALPLVGIPGAGKATLTAALSSAQPLPEELTLCVLDAQRLDSPEQIALVDSLVPRRENLLFVLNKCDLVPGPRTAVSRAAALLRERGFAHPEIFPVCAEAARLLALPALGRTLDPETAKALGDFYYQFAPGDNSLSTFALTGDPALDLGSREVTPEQLRIARENTGVPALEARLRELAAPAPEPVAEAAPAPEAAPVVETEASVEAEPPVEAEAPAEAEPPAAAEAASQPAAEADAPTVVDRLVDYLDAGEPAPAPREEGLADLLLRAREADCAGVLELARAVRNGDGDPETKDRLLDALHEEFKAKELTELRTLTLDADKLDLPALQALADRINAGPYTVQTRTPYVELLTHRMDELHSQALEELCAGLEEADSRTLAGIREAVEARDCAEILKNDCYRRIEARQDTLDREALDRVTAGAETMTEKELRALAVTLEAENWNPKYVVPYRQKIELLREAGLARQIQGELGELNEMERREVLALAERLREMDAPARFTAAPLAQVEERLYRMDMLRLMALNNDLDSLDFDGIDTLRAQVARGDFCDRAKAAYLDRLLRREQALILENTSARAELTRQLISQHKLRMGDFTIAGPTPDYQEKVEAFWGGTGLEQNRDLPVFLFDNASDYALTSTRFYYKSGRDLAYVPIEDIDHVQVMKMRLSLNLQIVGKDNSYRLTEAKISRSGAERTLDFLNDCFRRWGDPGLPSGRGNSALRLSRLDPAEFTAPVEPRLPDAASARAAFLAAYDAARLREGNPVRPGDEAGAQRLQRLRMNFGLAEGVPLIWYASATRLGPVKEGVAVGPQGIYVKESKLPLRTIPLEEIFSIRASGSKRVAVTTLKNETMTLDIAGDLAPLLSDYFKTLQLGNYLRREAQA